MRILQVRGWRIGHIEIGITSDLGRSGEGGGDLKAKRRPTFLCGEYFALHFFLLLSNCECSLSLKRIDRV